MPSSYARRRHRLNPLRRLDAAVRRDLAKVAAGHPRRISEVERQRLISAAMRFADPYLCADRDALLPAHRSDLRREFFRRAFELKELGGHALLDIGRGLAPLPDEPTPPDSNRLTSAAPSYDEALLSFRWLHRRHPRTGVPT